MSGSSTASVILGAANVEKFRGLVHSIGPFGLRVGFAFQQERALNVVASLKLQGDLEHNPKIAVIGGGLAGMSAYIALHGLGLTDTQLFEINGGVVRVQQAAIHRPIHPCYNNWPIVDFCNPTTNFPFFNWFAGSAKEVADGLQYRWLNHYSEAFRQIQYYHRVERIELEEDADGFPSNLTVSMKRQDPTTRLWTDIDDQVFDRVIFATGFGEESHLDISRCESYWTPDAIDSLRQQNEGDKIYISGTGDGGLMDCVRFCFQESHDCNLLVELMSYLRHNKYQSALTDIKDDRFERSPLEENIREIELKALKDLPDQPDPDMKRFGSDWENKISSYLQAEYLKIIPRLPSGVETFLKEILFPGWKNVRLVGRTKTPFSCATAPINKLIVAYLIYHNPDMYVQGYLDTDEKPLVLLKPDGGELVLEDEILVVRHGANPPVYDFSDDFKLRNKTLHKALAELTAFDRSEVDFCKHIRGTAECDPRQKEYIEARRELAQEFGLKYLGVKVNKSAAGNNSDEPPFFEFNLKQEEYLLKREGPVRQPGGHPHDLFGVRLVGVEPVVPRSATGYTT